MTQLIRAVIDSLALHHILSVIRTRAPGALADGAEIVPQRARLDDGPDEPGHRSTPSAYESGT